MLLALLAVGSAEAVYTPNPAGRWPGQRFFLAGDFHHVSDKDLDEPRGEVEDVTGFFVRPAFSVADNVVLYGRLGFLDADPLDSGFAGGFGAQAAFVLPRAPQWSLGAAFDFLFWDTETPGRFGRDVEWLEFQVTPAVSYRIPAAPQLSPYAGLAFDFLSGDVDEDDPVGLVFGANLDLPLGLRFDGQVRVVSETGFLLSAGYLF
jgi:hypothetical protein